MDASGYATAQVYGTGASLFNGLSVFDADDYTGAGQSRVFQASQARRVSELAVKEKRRMLQVTRYGDKPAVKGDSFPQGTDHLNVFFPAHGLFGAELLCHHILK